MVQGSNSSPLWFYDDFLPDERREELFDFLDRPGWEWGWQSHTKSNGFRFWHKHFAGFRKSDRKRPDGTIKDRGEDCEEELKRRAPLVWCFWEDVKTLLLKGHTLVRCYANGLQYGNDGMIHTDSVVDSSFTSVYYPHKEWSPNWGGETVFFNKAKDEIVGVSYPRPGRLCCFPGTTPHVARGLSRTCPVLRITLMFKTEGPESKRTVEEASEDQ